MKRYSYCRCMTYMTCIAGLLFLLKPVRWSSEVGPSHCLESRDGSQAGHRSRTSDEVWRFVSICSFEVLWLMELSEWRPQTGNHPTRVYTAGLSKACSMGQGTSRSTQYSVRRALFSECTSCSFTSPLLMCFQQLKLCLAVHQCVDVHICLCR